MNPDDKLLEAYEMISGSINDIQMLMLHRIPYEEWPPHLQIGGVNEELLGPRSDDKE